MAARTLSGWLRANLLIDYTRGAVCAPRYLITLKNSIKMKKTYFRDEYTEKEWHALIDEAETLGCKVTYGKYGDRAEIDSTAVEDRLLGTAEESDRATRLEWAEHIHGRIQKAADLRKWVVQPSRRHKGLSKSVCNSQRAAYFERERLERSTGFAWKIIVTQE